MGEEKKKKGHECCLLQIAATCLTSSLSSGCVGSLQNQYWGVAQFRYFPSTVWWERHGIVFKTKR